MVEAPPASARSTVVVRPCALHEVESLRRLRARALADAPDAYRQTVAEHERVSSAAWRRHFEARAAAGDATLIAEAGGEWIGFVFAIRQDDGAGRLGGMWIAPEARRCGAGRALVSAALAWLRAGDVRRVTVLVPDGCDAATALLRSAGFAPTGERDEIRPGLAAEEFAITLPPKSLRPPVVAG